MNVVIFGAGNIGCMVGGFLAVTSEERDGWNEDRKLVPCPALEGTSGRSAGSRPTQGLSTEYRGPDDVVSGSP